jgi:predicted N-acetyltransferase YhbS
MTSVQTHLPAMQAPPAILARDPVTIDVERIGDAEAREALLDRAFGPARFRKTCHKLRVGRLPARGLALVARVDGIMVGTVRLWHVNAGGIAALMLGPLAVEDRYRCYGVGARLMVEAIARAKALGHEAILLVGDAPYYERFGFARRHTLTLRMPGPVEEARFLGLELSPGVFAAAKGLVRATGAADLAARRSAHQKPKLRRAA